MAVTHQSTEKEDFELMGELLGKCHRARFPDFFFLMSLHLLDLFILYNPHPLFRFTLHTS